MEYFIHTIPLQFDLLSVFFLAVIAIVSLPSAVYAIGYLGGEYSARKIAYGWGLFSAFVASMALVVTAGNAFLFIVVWELMSLVSYFLVTFDSEHEKSVNAGIIYIVMTHIGTAFMIAAILMIYRHSGSFDFAAMKNACAAMGVRERDLVFIFFLIGFGTKAGIVPLHVWLPFAHPQAPSHVSSLMSGVMIKTAIYGFIRFVFMIMGVYSLWWANLILVAAAVSCLVGIIYALMEKDIKRLLAYSSVENVGVILLGVGLSMAFSCMNMPVLAVFAMSAGLYHLVNHAIFKALLFLCAGSVYKATGKRDMEKLGGLIKVMPWTAASFLAGSMAISAIPPFNGFISEWLTIQAFFLGAMGAHAGMKVFLSVLAAALVLTGGLAAACFVKAFGITFLAMPRSRAASGASEAPLTMRAAMVFMALLAAVFGLAASPIIKVLTRVSGAAAGVDTRLISFTLNNFVVSPLPGSGIYLSPLFAAGLVISIMAIAAVALYLAGPRPAVSTGRTWGCGYYNLDARTEYTATAFSKPFRIAFDFFLRPYRKTEKVRESYYHVKSFRYETHTTPVFRRYIYEPLLKSVMRVASSFKRLQPGSIHLYISYIFLTLLALIFFMRKY